MKSGFVAIVGRPNVGKSTLLNALVGRKIAIVSKKPQTTRNKIAGVVNLPDAQIIFLDTPGIHKPLHKLGEYMVKVAKRTLDGVDVVLAMFDASEPFGEGDKYVANTVRAAKAKKIMGINKIDLVKNRDAVVRKALEVIGDGWDEVLAFSALTGEGVNGLLEAIKRFLPEGPTYYPPGVVTDQPETFIISEIIREKILLLTREEVPHSVAVATEEMRKRPNGVIYVRAVIFVEKNSQKGILIGAGGRMIREIGKLAREELEALFGSKFYLELWVKVKEKWRNREDILASLGYKLA